MSAIADSTDGPAETVKVLFALFPGYNTLDVAGPLEVLSRSLHDPKNKCKSAVWSIARLHHPVSLFDLIGSMLTSGSQQSIRLSVRGCVVRHDVGPGPHHQGRHGLQ
jgi:hypothetical protein